MTRLFIRFYLGVLIILTAAWCIQAFIYRTRIQDANIQVIEQGLGGGVRLARDRLAASPPGVQAAVLEEMRNRFDYPLEVIAVADIPAHAQARFDAGDDAVLIGRKHGAFMVAALPAGRALQFGPLPEFVGPSQTEMMGGLAVILLLAAAAIAVLLRNVANQLRLVERTAALIAGGDFSARAIRSPASTGRCTTTSRATASCLPATAAGRAASPI